MKIISSLLGFILLGSVTWRGWWPISMRAIRRMPTRPEPQTGRPRTSQVPF